MIVSLLNTKKVMPAIYKLLLLRDRKTNIANFLDLDAFYQRIQKLLQSLLQTGV